MSRFRASRSTRSGRPVTQNEADVFDGLPIRQWRFNPSSVGATDDTAAGATGLAVDAPLRGKAPWMEYPMPKGSEQYPVWSQQLLREARLGRVVSAGMEYERGGFGREGGERRDEEKENESGDGEEGGMSGAKRARTETTQAGFTANRWMQVAKHLEQPEVEYLAKRRKGLPSVHGAVVAPVSQGPAINTSSVGVVAVAPGVMPVNSGTLKRTKVKRVDAQGLARVWDVLIPEGQPLEGELDETTITAEDAALPIEKPAAGAVVEGLGVADDDGVVIASFSAIPTAPAVILPPRGPRRKPKGGFKKGRSRKLGVGGQGGVSAAAESLYTLELPVTNDEDAGSTAMEVDPQKIDTAVDGEGDEGSEDGEIEESDDGEEAEGDDEAIDGDPDADMLYDNDDAVGDVDREDGELTPEASELDRSIPQISISEHVSETKPTLPPPASLPPKPPVVAAFPQTRPSQPLTTQPPSRPQSIPGLVLAYPPEPPPTAIAPTIEELATEPSVPVGEELAESSYPNDDEDMLVATPAETESSYAPPDVSDEIDHLAMRGGDVIDSGSLESTLPIESAEAMDVDDIEEMSQRHPDQPIQYPEYASAGRSMPPSSNAQPAAEGHGSGVDGAHMTALDEAVRRASEAQDAEDAAASLLAMATTPRTMTPAPRKDSVQNHAPTGLEEDLLGSLEKDLHRLGGQL